MLTGARSEDLHQEGRRREVVRAHDPYALLVAILSLARIPHVQRLPAEAARVFDRPFPDVVNPDREPVGANPFPISRRTDARRGARVDGHRARVRYAVLTVTPVDLSGRARAPDRAFAEVPEPDTTTPNETGTGDRSASQAPAAATDRPMVACAAVGLAGREGDPLRKALPSSLGAAPGHVPVATARRTVVPGWVLP